MLESRFRSQLVKACKAAGLYAISTEVPSSPGFPDMVLINNNTIILIELKIHRHRYFWPHFQPTQINWYREYFNHGNSNLWACFYLDRGTFGLTKITPERLKKVSTMQFKCDTIHTGYQSIAKELKNDRRSNKI